MLVPSMIAAIIFPKTASGLHAGMSDALQVLSRFLFNLYVIVIVVLIVSGNWLFPFLYGKSFNEMYYAFLLLSPGILSLSTLALLSAYFAGKDRLAVNLAGSVLSLVIIIAGDIMLIPKFGIKAAATVSSGGYICYLMYSMHIFRKEHKSNLVNFFILKKSDIHYVGKLFQKPGL
jgi:O-antigen/teichoic acid export membrane protein